MPTGVCPAKLRDRKLHARIITQKEREVSSQPYIKQEDKEEEDDDDDDDDGDDLDAGKEWNDNNNNNNNACFRRLLSEGLLIFSLSGPTEIIGEMQREGQPPLQTPQLSLSALILLSLFY